MVTTNKCRAKNPATCPYHGSLEQHKINYEHHYDDYLGYLKYALTQNSSPIINNELNVRKERAEKALALVDAHEEKYAELKLKLQNAQEATKLTSYEDYDAVREVVALQQRLDAAAKIRNEYTENENITTEPVWENDYVKYLPAGAVLSSGDVVTKVEPFRKEKMRVHLKRKTTGKTEIQYWNPRTKLEFQRPVPVPVEHGSDNQDPWG